MINIESGEVIWKTIADSIEHIMLRSSSKCKYDIVALCELWINASNREQKIGLNMLNRRVYRSCIQIKLLQSLWKQE